QLREFSLGKRTAEREDLFEQGDRRPHGAGIEMFEHRGPAARRRLAEHLLADLLAEEAVDVVDPFARGWRGGLRSPLPREIVSVPTVLSRAGAVELIEGRRGALPFRRFASLDAQNQAPTFG